MLHSSGHTVPSLPWKRIPLLQQAQIPIFTCLKEAPALLHHTLQGLLTAFAKSCNSSNVWSLSHMVQITGHTYHFITTWEAWMNISSSVLALSPIRNDGNCIVWEVPPKNLLITLVQLIKHTRDTLSMHCN